MEHIKGEWQITTKTAHLKGFLKSLKPQDLHSILYSEEEGEVAIIIAGIIRRSERKEKDKAIANAHLIAAAPDLLAACERLRRRAETGKAITQGDVDALQAVIAKAKIPD